MEISLDDRQKIIDDFCDYVEERCEEEEELIESTNVEQMESDPTMNKREIIKDLKKKLKNVELPKWKFIERSSETYSIMYRFLLGEFYIPEGIRQLTAKAFISGISLFPSYNPYDAPDVKLPYSIPERSAYLLKFNKLFKYCFFDETSLNFANVDSNISKFLSNNSSLPTLEIEYDLLRKFIVKLIIQLCTSTELAFKDPNASRISQKLKEVIKQDVKELNNIQQNGKISESFNILYTSLIGIKDENLIYNFKDYQTLNSQLSECYKIDFLSENLLGNLLKCYLPSLIIDYFYVIKMIYLCVRLLSYYMQRINRKNKDQTFNDLHIISTAIAICYENKQMLFKQLFRKTPRYPNGEIHHETEAYLFSHHAVGGQYYLLKTLEKSFPIIYSII
jgi:hypothetical protein